MLPQKKILKSAFLKEPHHPRKQIRNHLDVMEKQGMKEDVTEIVPLCKTL